MTLTRRLQRSRARQAYDLLTVRWRRQVRNQDVMDAVSPDVSQGRERVGRKPPISFFLAACGMMDPVAVARTSPLRDIVDSLRLPEKEGGMELDWRGGAFRRGPYVAAKVPGRNQPCDCGSGVKYKRCCLNGPSIPMLSTGMTTGG